MNQVHDGESLGPDPAVIVVVYVGPAGVAITTPVAGAAPRPQSRPVPASPEENQRLSAIPSLQAPPASAPGLDQLQHLGADAAGTALTVEGFEDQAGGGSKITGFGRVPCLAFEAGGPLLPLGAGLPLGFGGATAGQGGDRTAGGLSTEGCRSRRNGGDSAHGTRRKRTESRGITGRAASTQANQDVSA